MLKQGALGLTALGLIGWFLRATKPVPKPGMGSDADDGATPGRAGSPRTPAAPPAVTPRQTPLLACMTTIASVKAIITPTVVHATML